MIYIFRFYHKIGLSTVLTDLDLRATSKARSRHADTPDFLQKTYYNKIVDKKINRHRLEASVMSSLVKVVGKPVGETHDPCV